jgi:hypothetical protein
MLEAYSRWQGRAKTRAVAVVALVGAGCGIALITNPAARPVPPRIAHGTERRTVKTLQDRPLLRPARTVTLRYRITRPARHPLPCQRLPFERASSGRGGIHARAP